MKVTHIVTNLKNGGAQGVLFRLCKYDTDNKHSVISLYPGERYSEELRAIGIDVYSPNIRGLASVPMGFIRILNVLRKSEPDVVQTWLYHADFIGGIAAKIAGVRKIIWCIRRTNLEKGRSKRSLIILANVLSRLSWYIPTHLVFCADSARAVHKEIGYDVTRSSVVYNGYNDKLLIRDRSLGGEIRKKVLRGSNLPLIGSVGRYDPQKDYANLFAAIAVLNGRGFNLRCVLVGDGLDPKNTVLNSTISRFHVDGMIELLGPRSDIVAVMNALDVFVLPSSSEGFPNVLAEAMLCGTACVSTDVGDAAQIVGCHGWIAPKKNSEALADNLIKALSVSGDAGSEARSEARREYARRRFHIQSMVSGYHDAWAQGEK